VFGLGYDVLQVVGYPIGVIALLTLLVFGLAVRVIDLEWRGTPRQQQRDRDLMRGLLTIVARDDVVWLKEHDFGSPWEGEKLLVLARLAYGYNEVEHQFYDSTLEGRRQMLVAAIQVLLRESGQRSGIDRHGRESISAWDDSPSHRTADEREERKRESRTVIHKAADDVVAAYDALMSRARDRELLEREACDEL
jgi:hypothetical protein